MVLDAERRGADEQYAAIRRGREMIADQLIAMAANNVDSSGGSMAALLADTAGGSVYDALVARNNAEREAYGYRTQAAAERSRANIYRATGRNKAAGSLLTGAIGAGNSWLKYYKKPSEKTDLWNRFIDREW